MFADRFRGVIRKMFHCDGVFHLWDDPQWLSLMNGWTSPERQHDAGEYLLYLAGHSHFVAEVVSLTWQARTLEEGRVCVSDSGTSAPLVLAPPCGVFFDGAFSFTTQQLVWKWHRQTSTHAAWQAPPSIILQAGRFHYDDRSKKACKRRYKVVPDPVISFPVFDVGLNCHLVTYRLNSVVTHLGEAPTHGHSQTLLYQHTNRRFLLSDDGRQASAISDDRVASFYPDTYLFFYQQC